MEIKLETDFLLKNNLTPNEAIMLNLVHDHKQKILYSLATSLPQNPFEFEMPRLIKLEYLEGNTIRSLKLTEKGKDLIEAKDIFQELLDVYPTSVIRKDGKRSSLKTDKKRSKETYRKITKNRRDTHEYIIECLKYEINQRTAKGDMMWFKTLPNWLKSAEWENWGELMKEDARERILEPFDIKDYGTELE